VMHSELDQGRLYIGPLPTYLPWKQMYLKASAVFISVEEVEEVLGDGAFSMQCTRNRDALNWIRNHVIESTLALRPLTIHPLWIPRHCNTENLSSTILISLASPLSD
jgi:hypothetical protein